MAKFKPLKKALKKITRSHFVTGLISRLLYLYVKFTFITSKWEIRGLDNILNTWMEKRQFHSYRLARARSDDADGLQKKLSP